MKYTIGSLLGWNQDVGEHRHTTMSHNLGMFGLSAIEDKLLASLELEASIFSSTPSSQYIEGMPEKSVWKNLMHFNPYSPQEPDVSKLRQSKAAVPCSQPFDTSRSDFSFIIYACFSPTLISSSEGDSTVAWPLVCVSLHAAKHLTCFSHTALNRIEVLYVQ